MQKQYEVLRRASLFLEKNSREPKVAEILLMHHLGVSRSAFFARMREPVPESVRKRLEEDIRKHAETGIPVQHLTGYEYFYGRKFLVNEHVLIPRPETEELVLAVIDEVKTMKEPVIADIGTGSGVIGVTLALELEQAAVFATDLSKQALAVAEKNAERLGASISFLQGDFLQPLFGYQDQVNVLVSNPPYIAKAEAASLSDTVKNFDPSLALFADENGLRAYKQIIHDAKLFPKLKLLAFEIGETQGQAVSELVAHVFPESNVHIRKDMNGKDRIVLAHL